MSNLKTVCKLLNLVCGNLNYNAYLQNINKVDLEPLFSLETKMPTDNPNHSFDRGYYIIILYTFLSFNNPLFNNCL